MEQRFSLEGGQMVCRDAQGGGVEVILELRPRERGLYRGYLAGPGGRMDLGALLPERDSLRLRRTLSQRRLREQGCWPILGGGASLVHSFQTGRPGGAPQGWTPLTGEENLFPRDPLLAREVKESHRGLLRRQPEGDFRLAFPWDPASPFPLVPLFCFARVETLGGRPHLVFRFRSGGTPTMP